MATSTVKVQCQIFDVNNPGTPAMIEAWLTDAITANIEHAQQEKMVMIRNAQTVSQAEGRLTIILEAVMVPEFMMRMMQGNQGGPGRLN
jgi:hypothetical protein